MVGRRRSAGRRWWARALLVCGWLCASSGAAAAAPVVWVEPSWTRVSQTQAAGTATEIALFAGKGETESFQIIVRGPAGGLTGVNAEASDLVGASGTIGRANLTLYREHYIHVTVSSPGASGLNRPLGVGWYPDALIPFVDPATGQDLTGATHDAVPFALAADRNQPIWVDVAAPRRAAPGSYQGTFTVTSDQGSASVQVSLQVWGFELPLQPALKSCFGNDAASTSLVQELLRHRLMPRRQNVWEERTLMDTAGLNSANTGFWSGASGTYCLMRPAPTATQFQQAEALHQPDLFLYAYTADEILSCTNLYTMMKQWARNMHQSRILSLVTMPPVPELYDDGSGTGRSAVDIWVLLPKLYEAYQDRVQYVLDKGDHAWSYNCLAQDGHTPKWLLDYAPINYRIQPGFLNQASEMTGLLYWKVDSWTSDPWTNPNTYDGGYPGEGMLVYPGEPVGLPGQVVPSMRLKYLRDGVDDYDYIEGLKMRAMGEWAMGLVQSVAPDWRNWTRDPAALEAVRREFGPALEATFPDVAKNHWAYDPIMACRAAGIVAGYDDGTYRPAEPVTRDQMAVYIGRALAGGDGHTPTAPAEPTFPDVLPDYWAYAHVEYAVTRFVVGGYEDGTYRPKVQVTRAQMAAFVSRSICDPTGEEGLAGYEPPEAPTFRDLDSSDWAYRYVEYLHAQGIVGGFDNGTYRPNMVVTRDQMAAYIARAFRLPPPEAD